MDESKMIDIERLTYRFDRHSGGEIEVIINESDELIGTLTELSGSGQIVNWITNSVSIDGLSSDIRLVECINDFELFKNGRPEYTVISKHWLIDKVNHYRSLPILSTDTLDDMKETYIKLIQGCAFLRASRKQIVDKIKVTEQLKSVICWLDCTDFYIAPASTRYHESFAGGLLLHSLTVAARIIELADLSVYASKVNIEDAILCALVHDWCKIHKYEQYMRNQKNEETGQWEKVPSYKYREDIMIPLGHGETSMYMAMKMFNISKQEAVAIRNHMGKWAADNSYNITDLQYANQNYPLNLLLQFADQLACIKF